MAKPQDIAKIHSKLLHDMNEINYTELTMLTKEEAMLQLLKKYDKEIVDLSFFGKATWDNRSPKNTQAEIVRKIHDIVQELILSLNDQFTFTLRSVQEFFPEWERLALPSFGWESFDTSELPTKIEEADKIMIKTLHKFSKAVQACQSCIHEVRVHWIKDTASAAQFLATKPKDFHDIVKELTKEFKRKKKVLKKLKKIERYEEKLQKELNRKKKLYFPK